MDRSAPIFGFNDARESIVRTVVDRVVGATRDPLLALNDAAYPETKTSRAPSGPPSSASSRSGSGSRDRSGG